MLLFDVILAGLLFKIFGLNGLYSLAMCCMIIYIRMSFSTERIYKLVEETLYALAGEDECVEEKEEV